MYRVLLFHAWAEPPVERFGRARVEDRVVAASLAAKVSFCPPSSVDVVWIEIFALGSEFRVPYAVFCV